MSSISFSAPAKLNLTLHVTGKRDNGYHDIESLVVFTSFGDTITLAPGNGLSFFVKGPFATSLRGEDNLVMRAARALHTIAEGKGARLELVKNIPVGAGLGGGSSDAAATIRGLIQLWNISPSLDQLQDIACLLGSDVPVCLAAEPAFIDDTGTRVTPCVIADSLWAVLCNPGCELLTADVYRRVTPPYASKEGAPTHGFVNSAALIDYISRHRNMLEAAALTLQPSIKTVIDALADTADCLLARMSGSGATCFGLYATEVAAKQACSMLRRQYPSFWVEATAIQHSAKENPAASRRGVS